MEVGVGVLVRLPTLSPMVLIFKKRVSFVLLMALKTRNAETVPY